MPGTTTLTSADHAADAPAGGAALERMRNFKNKGRGNNEVSTDLDGLSNILFDDPKSGLRLKEQDHPRTLRIV